MIKFKIKTFCILLTISLQIHLFGQDNIQKQINECASYVQKYKQEINKNELLKYLNKLGYLYWQNEDLINAIETFKESIKYNEDNGNTNAVRVLCSNIGSIYIEKQDYENAITFLTKSISLDRQINKKSELLADLINEATAYQSIGKLDESITLLNESISLAKELNDMNNLKLCYSTISESYKKKGDSNKSQEFFELAATISGHQQKQQINEFQSRTMHAEETAVNTKKVLKATTDTLQEVILVNVEKQLQINLLNKEKQLKDLQLQAQQAVEKRRKLIILALILIVSLGGISLVIIFKQLRDKKRANRLLEKSNEEIKRQNVEIEKQHALTLILNQKITDSIHYASRIQSAILPPPTYISEMLAEHFIIYFPKNIVSGDFFWMTQKDDKLLLAVADCTGHGVSGAFMSMLGISFLNEIINDLHVESFHTESILNKLRYYIIESLHQKDKDNQNKDGMDIALCIIDGKKNHLEFSGAHNPLWLFRNNELTILDADRLPVGMHPNVEKSFTRKEFALEKNDRIYLFSDGYQDQLGEKNKTKFLSVGFKKLLAEIHTKPMIEQKDILIKKHLEWKGALEQIDDITVVGFRYG